VQVGFSEPLSFLQRLTEELEYADCLDAAAALDDDDSCLRLAYITAFSVSGYASTTDRLYRPFNPLLGETYECNRMADLGWKSIAEKVCLKISHVSARSNSSVHPSVCPFTLKRYAIPKCGVHHMIHGVAWWLHGRASASCTCLCPPSSIKVGTSFGWDIVHHRSGAGRLAAYRQTLQLVPTGATPASLIPVVAVVFICGLSDVLINEYLFIYLFEDPSASNFVVVVQEFVPNKCVKQGYQSCQ